MAKRLIERLRNIAAFVATMGGTTSVISFAAQAGGQQLSQTLLDYAARAKRGAMIDYAFHLTLTDLYVPSFEEDLAKLVTAGHRSLKISTTYNIQLRDPEVLKVLTLARKYGALSVCMPKMMPSLRGPKTLYWPLAKLRRKIMQHRARAWLKLKRSSGCAVR